MEMGRSGWSLATTCRPSKGAWAMSSFCLGVLSFPARARLAGLAHSQSLRGENSIKEEFCCLGA